MYNLQQKSSVSKPSIASRCVTVDHCDSVWLAAVFPIQPDSGVSVLASKPPLFLQRSSTLCCTLRQLVTRTTDKREHNQQWRRWLAHHVHLYAAVRAYLCNLFSQILVSKCGMIMCVSGCLVGKGSKTPCCGLRTWHHKLPKYTWHHVHFLNVNMTSLLLGDNQLRSYVHPRWKIHKD